MDNYNKNKRVVDFSILDEGVSFTEPDMAILLNESNDNDSDIPPEALAIRQAVDNPGHILGDEHNTDAYDDSRWSTMYPTPSPKPDKYVPHAMPTLSEMPIFYELRFHMPAGHPKATPFTVKAYPDGFDAENNILVGQIVRKDEKDKSFIAKSFYWNVDEEPDRYEILYTNDSKFKEVNADIVAMTDFYAEREAQLTKERDERFGRFEPTTEGYKLSSIYRHLLEGRRANLKYYYLQISTKTKTMVPRQLFWDSLGLLLGTEHFARQMSWTTNFIEIGFKPDVNVSELIENAKIEYVEAEILSQEMADSIEVTTLDELVEFVAEVIYGKLTTQDKFIQDEMTSLEELLPDMRLLAEKRAKNINVSEAQLSFLRRFEQHFNLDLSKPD